MKWRAGGLRWKSSRGRGQQQRQGHGATPARGGEPWAGSREGNSSYATLGLVWVALGVGHVEAGRTLGAEAPGGGPQPSALDPAGGHHPALLFTVHTPLDGREGPRPPQGARLEGAPRPRRGCCPARPQAHAAVGASLCQLCGGEGLRGWAKDSKGSSPRVDAGWAHTPKTQGGVGVFPGGAAVRTRCFHYHGLSPVAGQGTKTLWLCGH